MIPFGDKVTDYFRKYQSAAEHLDGILHALHDGQDELRKDNAALNLEKQLPLGRDGAGSTSTSTSPSGSTRGSPPASPSSRPPTPSEAKALRDDVLFYVRQKHQDLLTQLAVSIQNYLAIDIVIKNNLELIKGVDRAVDHHGLRAAHRRHRGAGAGQPEARPRPDHRPEHHDLAA